MLFILLQKIRQRHILGAQSIIIFGMEDYLRLIINYLKKPLFQEDLIFGIIKESIIGRLMIY